MIADLEDISRWTNPDKLVVNKFYGHMILLIHF